MGVALVNAPSSDVIASLSLPKFVEFYRSARLIALEDVRPLPTVFCLARLSAPNPDEELGAAPSTRL
jgi:hypothetical protein